MFIISCDGLDLNKHNWRDQKRQVNYKDGLLKQAATNQATIDALLNEMMDVHLGYTKYKSIRKSELNDSIFRISKRYNALSRLNWAAIERAINDGNGEDFFNF